MKRFLFITILTVLLAASISAQDIDLQLAVTTQALNRQALEGLDLDDNQIEEILALQEQFRLMKERTQVEMNLIKAQIAQKLYYANANNNEVNRLLEKASELRLEQEKEQVRVYQQIRAELGEEKWSDLIQRIRVQARRRLQEDSGQGNPPPGSQNPGSGAPGGSGGSSRR